MIDFAALKASTVAIVRALSGLSAVSYEDDASEVPPPAESASATFMFFGIAQIGHDERRYDRDTASVWGQGGDTSEIPEGGTEPPVIETVQGRREITLRIKVRSSWLDGNFEARFYLERMRTRLYRESTRALFSAAGLGFQEVLLATDANETIDGHRAAVAILDLRFNVLAVDVDTENPIPTIERVDVLGERR